MRPMLAATIIDETVEYLRTHRRATNSVLASEVDGKLCMCALGRCLKSPREFLNEPWPDRGEVVGGIWHFDPLDLFLRPAYRGHSESFWHDLAIFYDNDEHWRQVGRGSALTEVGREFAVELKEMYLERAA